MTRANRFGLGLKPIGIFLSEARFSPLQFSYSPFSFLFFYFSYVDGSLLTGTDDPAEAGKDRSGSKLHISNSGLPKYWKALFKNPTDHVL